MVSLMFNLFKALDAIVPPLVGLLAAESALGSGRRVVLGLEALGVKLSLLAPSPNLRDRRGERDLLSLFSILDC